MDAGDWIAAIAALIAFGAMSVAWLQAREAKESRHAAQAQAAAARDSAEIAEAAIKQAQRSAAAAEEQAKAATEQVAMMRQELERKDVPRFTVEEIDEFKGGPVVPVLVTMVGGVDLSEMTISAEGSAVRGLAGGPGGPPAPGVFRENFTEGSQTTVYLHLHEKTTTASATFTFRCTARENGKTWDALPPKTLELVHQAIRKQGQLWGRGSAD